MADFETRVVACFKALSIGDAIGKQTEMLSRADVLKWYPNGIGGFEGSPGDIIPRYRGKRYEWRIGETTDDTEQTIAVANALLRAGSARHDAIGSALLACRKSLHPEVRLWDFQQRGDGAHVAFEGDGCGAAMRVAPIGVRHRPFALDQLVDAAYECAIPTHGGQMAICAAAAVAAAVSAALDGRSSCDALDMALAASRLAEDRRPQTRPLVMTTAIERVYADLEDTSPVVVDDIARRHFPDDAATIVPLAIALALRTESAERTMMIAANIGGDADSVASIGGAIAGALRPESVNEAWFEIVEAVSGDAIVEVARALATRWPRV